MSEIFDDLFGELRRVPKATTTTITMVAAQPGWFIATFYDDEHELDPIVAWEIKRTAPIDPSPGCPGGWEVWREVTPIALGDNDFRSRNDWAIRRADGTFEIVGDQVCDDAAATAARLRHRAGYVTGHRS